MLPAGRDIFILDLVLVSRLNETANFDQREQATRVHVPSGRELFVLFFW